MTRETIAASLLTMTAATRFFTGTAPGRAGVTGIDCPGPFDSQHDCSPGSCETEPAVRPSEVVKVAGGYRVKTGGEARVYPTAIEAAAAIELGRHTGNGRKV